MRLAAKKVERRNKDWKNYNTGHLLPVKYAIMKKKKNMIHH